MHLKMEAPNRRTKKQLTDRWQHSVPQKKYIACGKSSTVCKCPKCGDSHRCLIQWTGRGMPRIYCPNCKPLIAAIDNFDNPGGSGMAARRSKRSSEFALE